MSVTELSSKALHGHSFSVPDLLLIRSWAKARGLNMVVRLDHGVEAEEYEEVLAFYEVHSSACRWIMWRSVETIIVQPMIGRPQHYGSVIDAVEALSPEHHEAVTDIVATHWPSSEDPLSSVQKAA